MQKFLIYHLYNSKIIAFGFDTEESAQKFIKDRKDSFNPDYVAIWAYSVSETSNRNPTIYEGI